MSYAKRVDENQARIVAALRQMGASVQDLSAVGRGVPDLLVGYHGNNYLLEIKDGDKPPSKRKLTQHQMKWRDEWRGTAHTIICLDDAIEVITHD